MYESTREEIQRKIGIIEQKIEEAHQLIPPNLRNVIEMYHNQYQYQCQSQNQQSTDLGGGKEEALETLIVGEERLKIKRKSYATSDLMKKRFNRPKRNQNQNQKPDFGEDKLAMQTNEVIKDCTTRLLSEMNNQRNQNKNQKGKHLERQPSFRNLTEKFPHVDKFKALYSRTTRIHAKKSDSPMVLSPPAQTVFSPMNVDLSSPPSFPISPTSLQKQSESSESTVTPNEPNSMDPNFSTLEEGVAVFQKVIDGDEDPLTSIQLEQLNWFISIITNLKNLEETVQIDFRGFLCTLNLLNETQNSTILWNSIAKFILGLLSESEIKIISEIKDVDFEKLFDTIKTDYQLMISKQNYQSQVESLKRKLEETENDPVPKRRKLDETQEKTNEENEKPNSKTENLPKWKILQLNSAKEAQERIQQESLIKIQKINDIRQKIIQKDETLSVSTNQTNPQKVSSDCQEQEELKNRIAQLNEEYIQLTDKLQQKELDCERQRDRITLIEKLKDRKAREKKALMLKKRRIAEENDCLSNRRKVIKEEREKIENIIS